MFKQSWDATLGLVLALPQARSDKILAAQIRGNEPKIHPQQNFCFQSEPWFQVGVPGKLELSLQKKHSDPQKKEVRAQNLSQENPKVQEHKLDPSSHHSPQQMFASPLPSPN